jgi:glycerol-3-phosphate dehydrogenase (NAD(P)+)
LSGRLAVIGAGAWGTALSLVARRAGSEVVLWARDRDLAREIGSLRENRPYLPGIAVPEAVRVVHDLAETADCDAFLLAVPAQGLRAVARGLAPVAGRDRAIVICAKGIEQASLALMSEVVAETLPGRPIAVLSGPTFAREVAEEKPTAVTLATGDPDLGRSLAAALGSRRFRPYLSDDPLGAQLGGAVKNVIAIACGIVAGRDLGDNARAALIARGLAEVVRLGQAVGGRAETLMGLSGLGDLTLTCTAMQSRNYSLGVALGRGESLAEVLGARRSVAEGVHSASAVTGLAERFQVEMPICRAVDDVVNRDVTIDRAVDDLLRRPFKDELR